MEDNKAGLALLRPDYPIGTVHTSYNLNVTRVAYARATRVIHAYF